MPTCPNCNHNWVEPTPALPDTFTDFLALADSVLDHVRATGAIILSHDDPRQRTIGFETASQEGSDARRWDIPLTRLKVGDVEPGSRLALYLSYMPIVSSRAMLAAMWSDGREPTERFRNA